MLLPPLLKEEGGRKSEESSEKVIDHDLSQVKHATAFTDAHHTPLLYT